MKNTLLFLVLSLLAGTAFAQAPYLSLEDVVSMKRVTSASISPDNSLVAYTVAVPREIYKDKDGGAYVELHVSDLDGNSTPFITGDVNVSSVKWSADGKHLFFVSKRDKDAKFNSIYRIAVSGGEAEKVFTHVSSIRSIFPSPDGERIAFTATDAAPAKKKELADLGFKAEIYEEALQFVHVWMLNLASGEAEKHDLDGHASTFAWDASGDRYAVSLAPTPLVDDSYTSRDIYVVDAAKGKVSDKIGSTGKMGAFEFSPDGERLAYIGSADIHDPLEGRLYVTSSSGGERRELVPNYMGHVAAFKWIDDVSIRWLGNRGVWREIATADTANATEAGPAPDSGVIIRSMHMNTGADVAVALADSPSHPTEVFVLRDGSEPTRITDSNPMLSERTLAKQEVITYKATDGLELEAILIHPAKKKRGGNPLVVIAHGGPESNYSNGWMTGYSTPGQVLAGMGYAVVYPNYRGSTGRGVEFSMMGQNDYADEEFTDLVDAKRHLVEAGLVDGDRVGITGGSYGGYASMWAASALTEEFAASVAFVGISNQISKFGTGDIPLEMYNVHSRAWPWDDWMWMLRRSPVYHAGNTKTPLLIMHGAEDPRVHPAQSMEMYRFVKIQTDTPVRLVFYPGEGHGNRKTAAQYDYGLRLIRWMEHYLNGPGGEPPPYELGHAERLETAKGD